MLRISNFPVINGRLNRDRFPTPSWPASQTARRTGRCLKRAGLHSGRYARKVPQTQPRGNADCIDILRQLPLHFWSNRKPSKVSANNSYATFYTKVSKCPLNFTKKVNKNTKKPKNFNFWSTLTFPKSLLAQRHYILPIFTNPTSFPLNLRNLAFFWFFSNVPQEMSGTIRVGYKIFYREVNYQKE